MSPLLLLAVLAACRPADRCHEDELRCDGPCPTLADVDPRVNPRSSCTAVFACTTAEGDELVEVQDRGGEFFPSSFFAQDGTLVATLDGTDVVVQGQCSEWTRGREVSCVKRDLVFDSCADSGS